MSYIQIPTQLLEADISPAQFRLCAFIIAHSVYNQKYNLTACFFGSEQIALELTGSKKAKSSTIKLINDLVNKGILSRIERIGNKAVGIVFNQDFDFGGSQNMGCLNNTSKTSERCLNNTSLGCLNKTDGCLKSTDRCLKNTPHIDLKFKNQDLKNNNAREGSLNRTFDSDGADSQIATGDGAPVRSKPIEESAREVMAASSAAKDADHDLLDAMRAKFTDIFADLSLSKSGNTYILRKKGKYALIEDVRLREVLCWLCARGLEARIMDTQTRVLGEVLLEEVA